MNTKQIRTTENTNTTRKKKQQVFLTVQIVILCYATTCSPVQVRLRFVGTDYLHLKGRRGSQARNQQEVGGCSSCFLDWLTIRLWKWRHYVLPKRHWTSTEIYGLRSRKYCSYWHLCKHKIQHFMLLSLLIQLAFWTCEVNLKVLFCIFYYLIIPLRSPNIVFLWV
jgi:hypothetical protein